MYRFSKSVPQIAAGVLLTAFGALLEDDVAHARMVDMGDAKKTVIGYALPWTSRPGETVEFRVSTYAPGDYHADLIRLKSADEFDEGKRFAFEEIKADFAGSYAGRHQPVHAGSYVQIDNPAALDGLESFTIAVTIYPTLLPSGKSKGTGNVQYLVSRWNDVAKAGWGLSLDAMGRVSFVTGRDGKQNIVSIPTSLTNAKWYRISAVFDSKKGVITLRHDPLPETTGERFALKSGTTSGDIVQPLQQGPLRFGAATGGPGNGELNVPVGVFNGKLDSLRIVSGALNEAELGRLFASHSPREFGEKNVVGYWDFSKGIGTVAVHDLGKHALHGVAVNLPERAVPGARWDGSEFNWKQRPDHYSAIYFHDDDVYDLNWKVDFSYKIPEGLPSGVYAVRLRHGKADDYIPFYVAPPKGVAKAKVAFLLPTVSYLAYSNITEGFYYRIKFLEKGPDGVEKVREEDPVKVIVGTQSYADFLIEHPEMPGGVYRIHTDGTAVKHASRRYPNITARPNSVSLTLNADLDIIEWLDHEGVNYDLITDDILEEEGVALLDKYDVVLSGNHPEYVTPKAWNAIDTYLNQGGRFMYLGGNGFYWVTSFHQQVPDVIEVRKAHTMHADGQQERHRAYQEFDGRKAGYYWDVGQSPHKLVGIGMTHPLAMWGGGFYRKKPDAENPRAKFIFEGIQGDVIGNFGKFANGAVSEELDAADFRNGTPPHALIVASSEDVKWPYDPSPAGMVDRRLRLNAKPPKADMVFFETPNNGAVFSVGSMGWRASLNYNGFDNNVSKVTANVLKRFMDPQPFAPAP